MTNPLKRYVKNIKSKVILFSFLFLGLFIVSYFSVQLNSNTHSNKNVNFPKTADQMAYDKWSKLIEKVGGEKAYSEFKTDTKNKDIRNRHYSAHIFGEALYNTIGSKGIFVCDNEFDSGCYHSFMAEAIANQGLDVVADLSLKCSDHLGAAGGGCQHGIGHGVLSSIGYDFTSLNKAIGVCNTLEDIPSKNCLHGVFMEYNFQTMLLDQGKIRTFDENNPYFPCFSVSELARNVCMNQQAQWWTVAIKKNLVERAREIDYLCTQSGNLNNSCFRGFGVKLLPFLAYDNKKAQYFCNSLTDPQSKNICLEGVTSHLPM